MPRPGFVTQQELANWADTFAAPRVLPRLIRRLVLETGVGICTVDFPAAEGTAVGGWDGVAQAKGDAPFVPAGLTLWEISSEKSVGVKAEHDYAKRTDTPDGSPTTAATYCAVALRRWRDRRKWAGEKKKDKRWNDVRTHGLR